MPLPGATTRVWGLLGNRTGDNNQLLALCEALGLPFETRTLSYNVLQRLNGFHLRPSFASLTHVARRHLQPPWPDLLITIGRLSVPIARRIKRQSGGATKLVLIGYPRSHAEDFDLIISTRQYPPPRHPNVLILTLAMSRIAPGRAPSAKETSWLDAWPRPHLLLAIGGSTRYFDLVPDEIGQAAADIRGRAERAGGTLIVTGSPRTEDKVLRAATAAAHVVAGTGAPAFPVLMNDADEIFVTADSLAMTSEAVLTRKPVGLVPIELNRIGRRRIGSDEARKHGVSRDMRRIWDELAHRQLVGTVDAPVCGNADNPVREAAAAVRRLLG